MPPQLFLISVYLPDRQEEPLRFKVTNFKREDGRTKFIDRKTGQPKDFPNSYYTIEGVEK